MLTGAGALMAQPLAVALTEESDGLKGRMWKTLKIGMVNVKGSLTDKFKAVKEAGFDGIEMDAPGMNVEETKKAIAESGLPVDGTVNSTHWQIRHTDADAAIRAKALESLQSYDLGGITLGYSPTNRIGSRYVEVTVIGSNGRLMK